MDDIVRECAARHLSGPRNLNYVEDTVIQRTFSFEYEPISRLMLIRHVGLIKVEQLEGMLDPVKFHLMKTERLAH